MESEGRVRAKEKAEVREPQGPPVGSVLSLRRAVTSDSTVFAPDRMATEDPGDSLSGPLSSGLFHL